jgi:hypothetical protein
VVNQREDILPSYPPPFPKINRGERRELIGRQAVELEAAATALQLDLITVRSDLHRLIRKFPGDLLQFLARGMLAETAARP